MNSLASMHHASACSHWAPKSNPTHRSPQSPNFNSVLSQKNEAILHFFLSRFFTFDSPGWQSDSVFFFFSLLLLLFPCCLPFCFLAYATIGEKKKALKKNRQKCCMPLRLLSSQMDYCLSQRNAFLSSLHGLKNNGISCGKCRVLSDFFQLDLTKRKSIF